MKKIFLMLVAILMSMLICQGQINTEKQYRDSGVYIHNYIKFDISKVVKSQIAELPTLVTAYFNSSVISDSAIMNHISELQKSLDIIKNKDPVQKYNTGYISIIIYSLLAIFIIVTVTIMLLPYEIGIKLLALILNVLICIFLYLLLISSTTYLSDA